MDLVCDLAAVYYHIGEMLMAGYFQWHPIAAITDI